MSKAHSHLVVLGAGPKACAIWTKHTALVEEGVKTAPISIIEKNRVAANWSGAHGYTDGVQYLVSPSEQDLGFPYSNEVFGADLTVRLTERMFKYSWQNFLLSVGGYPEWVAKDRPRAPHYQFRDYLEWVGRASKLEAIQNEITKISIDDKDQWSLSGAAATQTITASGLVVTGNGKPRRLSGQPDHHSRIWNGETFWAQRSALTNAKFARIAVIGSGETAAAIACSILDHVGESVVVELICKQYAYFTRAEVAKDLVYFSDPSHWQSLREGRRFSIMRRADRGVVSSTIKTRLEESELVEYTTAEAVQLKVTAQDEILLSLKYDGQVEEVPYQFVVVATGFDAMWFFELFDDAAKLRLFKHLLEQLTSEQTESLEAVIEGKATPERWLEHHTKPKVSRFLERAIERLIDTDLSLRHFSPALHLPMMSGLSQGPGFPNLNCLGLMAERILKSYLL
ncbi:MAG: SidA/IucD/PvdA family monooxygenase [Candidatus Obscuribacterales bacterium]|nr:SidA/IucD/PvdA family monooxygenase [Candidatus Obscuribacterales bacterium]